MKKTLLLTGTLFIIALLISAFYFTGKFRSDPENRRIRYISLQSRIDTISYALGSVWARDIEKYIGIKTVNYAFYSGLHDYLRRDSSKMGIYMANIYLQNHLEAIKSDSIWPAIDDDLRLNKVGLVTKQDSFCYALGFAWCAGAYEIGIHEISPAIMIGLLKGFKGDTSLFKNYASANRYLMSYVEELRLKKYGNVKKINEDWLVENGKKEGVKTLPDGVQYRIMRSGNGISITENDIIECHYIGKLINGSIFDNAYQSGPTFRFYLSSVIEGWGEALKLMKEGDEWIIYIPYNLAYGSEGMGDLVPPYSAIMIDVEIVKVTRGV